jgi:single-strand DNA-binding protein
MNGMFVTIEGVVGTEPKRSSWAGGQVTSFRIVAKERKFNKSAGTWMDLCECWMNVGCFRDLAEHAAASIRKGDRVLVHGRLRIKEWQGEQGERRLSVDLEADSVGHNLKYGTTRFQPARPPEDVENQLREQAERLAAELAEQPRESMDEILAQRASIAELEGDLDGPGESGQEDDLEDDALDGDDLDGEDDDDLDGEDDDPRRHAYALADATS